MSDSKEILNKMLAAVPDSYQKTVLFPTYDILAAASIPMAEADARLEAVKAKLDPANLTGAELDAYISSRTGQIRNGATYALGVLTVNGNGTVTAGDLFESGGGIQFVATQTVTISGTGTVPIRCTRAGPAGNLPADSITMMPIQLAGIVSVSNLDPTAEGYDAETDEAYFSRYQIRIRTPPTSGNQYHYRLWALEVAGVGDVQVYPLGHGDNTVDVVIIDAAKQPASTTLVGKVQEHIDPNSEGVGAGEAPIGAHCYVSAAQAVTLALSLTVTPMGGVEQAQITQAIQKAVAAYLASVAFKQDYASYAKISDAILDVEWVTDLSGLTVNGGTANVSVADRQVAVLGEVTVTYAE